MKNKLSLFCACFVFTLTFFPSFIRADAGIKIIQQEITVIEKQLSENNLKGMHEHAEAIVEAAKKLDQDSTLDETKKKHVQGYTKNLAKLADKLHDAADLKKLAKTKKIFTQLKSQADLLAKQFPKTAIPESPKGK